MDMAAKSAIARMAFPLRSSKCPERLRMPMHRTRRHARFLWGRGKKFRPSAEVRACIPWKARRRRKEVNRANQRPQIWRSSSSPCRWRRGAGRFFSLGVVMNDTIRLDCDDAAAVIAVTGAEPLAWSIRGRDLFWQPDPAYWIRTSPVLFPIVGRARNDTIRVDGRL